MSTPLEDYFDGKIFVINLAKRPDRWEECLAQFRIFGITRFERFEASVVLDDKGQPQGDTGCTASHRRLLDLIAYNRWPRALILEDDFLIVHGNFMQRFAELTNEIVPTYDMLYLGGHYGEPPISRVSPHVIRCGRMLTTSSYAVTWKMAAKMAPHVVGLGPIDSIYGGFHRDNNCLIVQPRLMIQRPGVSDLQGRHMDNSQAMLDTSHETLV